MSDPIVIVAAKRTPIGNFLGEFSKISACKLGSIAIKSALQNCGLSPEKINETWMGCVLSAGLGQAPARQAALGADIPASSGAVTINKMCGSGMQTVMMAADHLKLHANHIVVAGGMENMSQAPFMLPKARAGMKFGHQKIQDHMQLDGLEDAYSHQLMGHYADATAKAYDISRENQDAFAARSLQLAKLASFEAEMINKAESNLSIEQDERPQTVKAEKIHTLKPAFNPDGTVTAANASGISDGAAALILMRASHAEKLGVTPLAKVCGYTRFSGEPAWFTTAPVEAMKNLSNDIDWPLDSIDLFEINEAFAVVTLAAQKALKLPQDKINVHGGACALGHPIGASGARIITTLIHALHHRGLSKGMASICIGGGEATAIAIERMT